MVIENLCICSSNGAMESSKSLRSQNLKSVADKEKLNVKKLKIFYGLSYTEDLVKMYK